MALGCPCNVKVALGGIQPCVLQVVVFSSAGRAGTAIVPAACQFGIREHLSRRAAHRSQALCRVLARAEQAPPGSQAFSGADECVCDSGSQQRAGSACDSWIFCEGVQGKSPAAVSIPLTLLLPIPVS